MEREKKKKRNQGEGKKKKIVELKKMMSCFRFLAFYEMPLVSLVSFLS